MCLAERARPRAQQTPSGPTPGIFNHISLALDAAAPEDGRAPPLDLLAHVCSNFVLSNAKCDYKNVDINLESDKRDEFQLNLYKQSQENVVKYPLIL